jgi:hypothetical protein
MKTLLISKTPICLQFINNKCNITYDISTVDFITIKKIIIIYRIIFEYI